MTTGLRAQSLSAHLASAAADSPDRPWLNFPDVDAALTFHAAQERVARCSRHLAGAGVTRGDRVALLMENSADFVIIWFATRSLGAIVVALHTALRGDMLAHQLTVAQPRLIVTDPALIPVVTALDPLPGVVDVITPDVLWSGPAISASGPAELSPDEASSVLFTSGTTGPAKGVGLTDAALLTLARESIASCGRTADDSYYVCLPFFHLSALGNALIPSLLLRAPIFVRSRFSVRSFWSDVARMDASATIFQGAMVSMLASAEPTELERNHRIEAALVVPSAVESQRLLRERFGIRPIVAYGLTDIGGHALHSAHDAPAPPGSCGRPAEAYELLLADEAGNPVPPGTPGELLIRPRRPGIIGTGYWGMPERTVEAWRDLWFHTGDILRRDDDGWFYFVDRKKDVIRRRGENISTYELEQALLRHPLIEECAAFGVASELTEQDVAVAVRLADGASLDPSELPAFLAGRVPRFAVPRFVDIRSDFPRTPTGKIAKLRLRELGVTETTWDAQSRIAASWVT